MSDYYLLLYMGIDVCQIAIYCSTGGIGVCQITFYCSTGELIHGN